MRENKDLLTADELPFTLNEARWGQVRCGQLEYEGIYYISTQTGEYHVAKREDAQAVFSTQALAYGIQDDQLLLFPTDESEKRGAAVIEYELKRRQLRHGQTDNPLDPIASTALYGAEDYPDYFGAPVPPVITPSGTMTRYLTLSEGIFVEETERLQTLLAISFPIWQAELSPLLQKQGLHIPEQDGKEGEYLFFPIKRAAPTIYELLELDWHDGLRRWIKSQDALIAAIWREQPEYALYANLLEQRGCNKPLSTLCGELGLELPEEQQELKQKFLPLVAPLEQTRYLLLPDSWESA